MSFTISPIPTAGGITRALNAVANGAKLDIKYIGIGKGHQTITVDAQGFATTETLADHIDWVTVDKAFRTSDNQWQFSIDIAGVSPTTFDLSEIILADENHQSIAIYGHASNTLFNVTTALNSVIISSNLVLTPFPADSINIIHLDQVTVDFYRQEVADQLTEMEAFALTPAVQLNNGATLQKNKRYYLNVSSAFNNPCTLSSAEDGAVINVYFIGEKDVSVIFELTDADTIDGDSDGITLEAYNHIQFVGFNGEWKFVEIK